MEKVGIIDLSKFLENDSSCDDLCKEIYRSFKETGILIVKDPRFVENSLKLFLEFLQKKMKNLLT
jgi:hypothetical protein